MVVTNRINFQGFTCDFDDGRSILVGRVQDGSNDVFIKYISVEGFETPIRLSAEAAYATAHMIMKLEDPECD